MGWWWYSFGFPGSMAVYLALYSVFSYMPKLELDSILSHLIFLVYMFWMCVTVLLMFGSIGTLMSLFFLIKLYSTMEPEHITAEEAADAADEEDNGGYMVMMESLNHTSLSATEPPPSSEEPAIMEQQPTPSLEEPLSVPETSQQ